jgi:hypothetical protein
VDRDFGDDTFAERLIQGLVDLRKEKAHLGGPGRGIRDQYELPLMKSLRAHVLSEVSTHDVSPPGEHIGGGGLGGPPLIGQKGVQGAAQQLRVSVLTQSAWGAG